MNTLCYVCGHSNFQFSEVLDPELIIDWELSTYEVDYINRQQGVSCTTCGNNLRSIALAKGICSSYGFDGTLIQFVESERAVRLRVLEINPAGCLTSIFRQLSGHKLITYPEYDMTALPCETGSFDLILHSDSLEHVPDPLAGLSECRRVLMADGRCIFTVPVVVDRLTRSRAGLKKSYHGSPGEIRDDYLVHTEFGADIWKFVFRSGFSVCYLHCIEYPAALAIEARC